MFQRVTTILFVCTVAFAQDIAPLKGPASGRLSQAPVITLGDVIESPDGGDRNIYSVKQIEPDAVMPFIETEEGHYFTLLRYDVGAHSPVRLHFSSFHLREGARLFVYSVGANGQPTRVAGPYQGAGPEDLGDFWSGAMPGGTVVVELQVRGEPPSDLPFEVDSVVRVESLIDTGMPTPLETDTRTSVFRGVPIEHQVIDGEGVFEGDILLGRADELQPAGSSHSKSSEKSAVGITSTYHRWPNGVIPYIVDASVANKTFVADAIRHWNTKLAGVISLVPRSTQTDYVRFIASSRCSSYVGKVGGRQDVQLSSACTTGVIIHEIGHVAGLFHEQCRQDRNSWIRVLYENILLTSVLNFYQQTYSADDLIYYGYNSIMHYAPYSYSSNGDPTIETIPPGIPAGQRVALDVSDIAAVRRLYNRTNTAVQISSVPTGLTVTVDGVSVVTPVTYNWTVGSAHRISAPSTAGTLYGFVRWTDGGAQTHTIVVPTTGLTVAATYASGHETPGSTATGHKVTTSVAAPGTGTLTLSPARPAYSNGASVKITAKPGAGYCFTSWTGLIAGTPSETTLHVTKSYSVRANFKTGAVTPAYSSVGILGKGATFPIHTSASTGCGWTIKPNVNWITVSKTFATSSSPGFSYTVAPNTTGAMRTGTITVDDATVTIIQFK